MMERFEDSPDLFGRGMGSGTCGELQCDWCGKVHNKGCGNNNLSDVTVKFTYFGELQICEDCFGEVEQAVLSRMKDILPWYKRILDLRRKALDSADKALKVVVEGAK